MYRHLFKIISICLLISIFCLLTGHQAGASYNLKLGERLIAAGDEGPDVALLQRKLKELSYYTGEIDGLYGPNTANAVKNFQRSKGITVDGIIGSETLSYLSQKTLLSRLSVDRDEIILLARIIHGEARGENFKGKVAVGAVVLNRVSSNKFPNSIREVILQEGQFSCLNDGQANYYPLPGSIDAARAAIMGYDPTFNSLYFYNPEVATRLKWISKRPITLRIGQHIFAR